MKNIFVPLAYVFCIFLVFSKKVVYFLDKSIVIVIVRSGLEMPLYIVRI